MPSDDGPSGYLPRLPDETYRGYAVILWTHTVADRATGWLDGAFHARFREVMVHAAVRESVLAPIYTLMPDHIHVVWMGLNEVSDQRLAARFLRRFLAANLEPVRWQHQPHDRILRGAERRGQALAEACHYVAENPVRAGLVASADAWPYTGCLVPGYPDLHPFGADYWDMFWRLYNAASQRGGLGKLAVSPAV